MRYIHVFNGSNDILDNSNLSDEFIMKRILTIGIGIVAILFFYGVYTAKSQLDRGVSLMEIAFTANSMNPISLYGYRWVMRDDSNVQDAVEKMNGAYDKLKDASEN